jgi:predicted dehydrogenase
MIGIGVIGYGHWGPNHVRVFGGLPDCRIVGIADGDERRLQVARQAVPGGVLTTDFRLLLRHPEVQAVVVSTPLTTHHAIVKEALLADKDVLVEKPICHAATEADELLELAETRGRVLMCGHIFLFNAAIRKLRDYIREGTLGRIYYMSATRTNLGPLRRDANALYDLGSHDVSIFHYLLDEVPIEATAWGECYLQRDIEDVAFACLEFPGSTLCHMHVSWLNPRKERTLVVVGEKKMAVWDDMQPLESIRLYDKGVMQEPYYDSFGQFQLALRDADILIPKLPAIEPLVAQDRHFIECVRDRKRPTSDGIFAREVVVTLGALQRSLHRGGARQRVGGGSFRAPGTAAEPAPTLAGARD